VQESVRERVLVRGCSVRVIVLVTGECEKVEPGSVKVCERVIV